ncbi:MAG: family 20 glycosylhydrolase [Bacteroidales bacterium]
MKRTEAKTGILILVIAGILTASCNREKFPGSDDIHITWEVISNTYDKDQAAVKAEFTIGNKSEVILTDENWSLYYNQSPRFVLNPGDSSGTQVEHISGDWYRIFPAEGFELLPGEKFSLTYESRYWWIKESDAPHGLYFVFTNSRGKETIVTADNFTIVPFERTEQLSRHFRDETPVPTPEILFHQNKNLKELHPSYIPPIVPTPVFYVATGEKADFTEDFTIHFAQELQSEALHLQKMLKDIFGWELALTEGHSDEDFSINLMVEDVVVNGKSESAYKLEINEFGNIYIRGTDPSGVFYGIQSLIALLPLEAFSNQDIDNIGLPLVKIEDVPRFGYRGVHVDVSRNFFPKESILKMIDILAFYKINTLHMHLTDDEGWRLEIKTLPELTEVGAQRGHTGKDAAALHPAFGSGPFPYAPDKSGSGFYTQEDFVEILQYAYQRHIRVIPEINMPGHARAAIKSMEARYNYYMDRGDEEAAEEFRLIDPDETSEYLSAQLYNDNVVNVARESTYRFFETVLDEVIEMYEKAGAPLEIIHVGGDEVPRGAWSASPMIEELMEKLDHINNPRNMHSWFTERTLEIITARGLKMAGWEEVALKDDAAGNNIPNITFADGNVIPYVWNNLRGAQDLAYRLANRDFPVVLCHVTSFYFDLAYNKDPEETGLYWGGFVKTRDAWHFNPYDVFKSTTEDNMGRPINIDTEYRYMDRLNPAARENILGVQAQLWSETIVTPDLLEYYLLPKLIGFAETAWVKKRIWENTPGHNFRNRQVQTEWNAFANALGKRELPRLAYLFGGFNYRVPTPGVVLYDGFLEANTEFPGLQIRYTVDGSEPGPESALFTGKIKLSVDSLRVKTFDTAGRSSRTLFVESNPVMP